MTDPLSGGTTPQALQVCGVTAGDKKHVHVPSTNWLGLLDMLVL